MKPRSLFIAITVLAVFGDTMLTPFYPQFFASRFGITTPTHAGTYLAAISCTVMLALPVWARVAKYIDLIQLLIWTQLAAAMLAIVCYFAASLTVFWLASLAMIAFKASYPLIYPHVVGMEKHDDRTTTIGLLAVVVHLFSILSALVAGAIIQTIEAHTIFLIMALVDVVQIAICLVLARITSHATAPQNEEEAASQIEPQVGTGMIYRLCFIMLLFYFSVYLTRPFFTAYWQSVSVTDDTFIAGSVFAIPGVVALIALVLNRFSGGHGHRFWQRITPMALIGAGGLLLQASAQEWLILVGRCIFGWSLFQITVGLDARLFVLSSPEAFAVNFSKIFFFQNLGVIGSSFTAGWLVKDYGLALPLLLAAVGLVFTAITYPRLLRADNELSPRILRTGS